LSESTNYRVSALYLWRPDSINITVVTVIVCGD